MSPFASLAHRLYANGWTGQQACLFTGQQVAQLRSLDTLSLQSALIPQAAKLPIPTTISPIALHMPIGIIILAADFDYQSGASALVS